MRTRVVPLLTLAVFVGSLRQAGAQSPEQPAWVSHSTTPRVVFTAGVSGRFADPVCDGPRQFEAAPFAVASAALTQASDDPRAFSFDTGGFFAPHGVGRFAIDSDTAALVALTRGLGFDAMAFAAKDLQASRTPFVMLVRALREAGTPFVASNLRCADGHRALCDVMDDASDPIRISAVGEEKFALIAMIDPAVLAHVAEENRSGLELEPLATAMHRRVEEARALGATLVIATIDNGSGARAAGEAIGFAESLPAADRPDLLVASRAGGELLFARPRTFSPPIASAPPGSAVDVALRRADVGLDILVQPLAPVASASHPIATFTETVGPEYCRELGRPLAGGSLATPMDRTAFADLVGGAMRVAADAEIAVMNLPLVSNGFERPAGHALTASDLHLAIQFDEPVMRTVVDAPYLTALARRIAANPQARAVGLAIANPGAGNESITINGRPIDARGKYSIVTPRYLATGGDQLFATGAQFRATTSTVRGATFAWLDRRRSRDPRLALPNPAERLEWTFAFDSDTSLGRSSISNPGNYADTQFERTDSVAYGTQNQLDLVARSTRLAWENQLLLRYRTNRNRGEAVAEADDLLSFRTTFAYREPRTRHAVWYVPEPFGEAYVESELTVPDTRPDRHFLVRPTLGARFTLTSVLALKLQAGGAFELFDRSVDPSPGVGAVLTLTQWRFFSSGRRSGTLEGTFDWFLSGLGVTPLSTLRGNVGIGLQLNQVLGLSFTSTLFGVKRPGDPLSIALNSTANLRLRWFVRTQR